MDELDKILQELNEKREEYKKKYVRGKGLLQIQMEEASLVKGYKAMNLDYRGLYPHVMKSFNIKPDDINIKRKEKIDKMRNPNQI
jgi:DNA polymerase elongation subunit (family B)